jgi:hypothetical protein
LVGNRIDSKRSEPAMKKKERSPMHANDTLCLNVFPSFAMQNPSLQYLMCQTRKMLHTKGSNHSHSFTPLETLTTHQRAPERH